MNHSPMTLRGTIGEELSYRGGRVKWVCLCQLRAKKYGSVMAWQEWCETNITPQLSPVAMGMTHAEIAEVIKQAMLAKIRTLGTLWKPLVCLSAWRTGGYVKVHLVWRADTSTKSFWFRYCDRYF